jgi:hypothetical protein
VSDAAKPDVPPPRYTGSGGWRDLVKDEQEWLARPAPWGIWKLPDEIAGRKQNLYNAHFYGWQAGIIECDECRAIVKRVFTDDGTWLNEQVLAEWNLDTPHTCDMGIRRRLQRYRRGVVSYVELFNGIVDELYENENRLSRTHQTHRYHESRRAKERELALELVGPNPFRPVAFDAAWRTSTATVLASQMYESRDFGAMPILADALQDAGCTSDDILAHCRDPHATHVRGCWVVDLVLGKS